MAKIKFTTTLEEEIVQAIKIQAIREKTSVAKLIEKLISEYLKDKTDSK